MGNDSSRLENIFTGILRGEEWIHHGPEYIKEEHISLQIETL